VAGTGEWGIVKGDDYLLRAFVQRVVFHVEQVLLLDGPIENRLDALRVEFEEHRITRTGEDDQDIVENCVRKEAGKSDQTRVRILANKMKEKRASSQWSLIKYDENKQQNAALIEAT
jgi:hypothetical protein